MLKVLWWPLIVCLVGGCDLPRDPEGTTNRVRNGALRVGVMHDPPWVEFGSGGTEFSGVEVRLVRQLADELGAEIEWHPAGETRLMKALQNFELDLVIGGLTDSSVWKKHVALTRPYRETQSTSSGQGILPRRKVGRVMAAPPGENAWLLTLERFLQSKHR